MGKHMKKRIGLIFAVLLFSVLGFSACGDPYKKMSFSLSSDKDLTQTVELYLGKSDANLSDYDIKDEFEIKAQVKGVGKDISTEIVVPEFDDKVDISTVKSENHTTIKITAKSEGETILSISPKENPDGKFTRYVRVKVSIGLTSFRFKSNAIGALAIGDTLNLNVDSKKYIDFFPSDTSQTNVEYSIQYPDSSVTDYAEIINGVLYTYDSENYPVVDGRRVITLVAKCPTRDDLTDTFSIPVIEIENNINISTTYKDDTIELDKNDNGKYEIILAHADISMSGGSVDEDITNRILHIGLGEENSSTSKYRVSVVGEYSLSAGTPVIVSSYDIEGSVTADFLIKSSRVTNGTDVVFKIEYFGDSNDNPNNDETLYQGLFTQYVTFTIKVYSLPDAKNMTINGKSNDEQTYIVYDTYYKATESNINENGTLFKVKLAECLIPNIVANIEYTGDGFDVSGLSFVGGTKTANGITIANGESFYLKHTYTQSQIQEDAERRPYITISITYSFAPSNATSEQKDMYFSDTISKKVYLDFKAGINEINLPSDQIGLEITSDEWQEFFVFPEGYDARATVDQILGRNLSLVELKYDSNKIMIRSNQQFQTGEVSLVLVATNGKMSNTANIMVYLPVLYTQNDTLLVDVDENDDAVFVVGEMTGDNEYDKTGTVQCDYNTHQYDTYTNLILASHSSLALDVYSIMEEGGYLKKVLPNIDVTCDIANGEILSWTTTQSTDGVLSGTLTTLGVTDIDGTTITFTLKGYKPQDGENTLEEISITHTINIWVFDAISKIDFSLKLNEVYLKDSLGYYDKGDSKYTYDWNKLPEDGVNGNFGWDINLKNADQVSHTISLDLLGNNALGVLVNKLFRVSLDDYDITIVDDNNNSRLKNNGGNYTFDILNSDILVQTKDEEENNDGFEAKINSNQFVVTITPKTGVGGDIQTHEIRLTQLFEKMFENRSEKEIRELALAYIFNGKASSNFRDFVLCGQAKQFERSVYVETIIRVYKPVKVSSIDVSVSKEGLYFEREMGKTLSAQAFTYNVLPYNAYNNDIMVKIYNNIGNSDKVVLDDEKNIVVTTTEYFTLSASDSTVTIDNVVYGYDKANNKLCTFNEETQEYDIETDMECGLFDSNTIWVKLNNNSNEDANKIASATIQNGKITITIENNISGNYVLRIIAKDSTTQKESGEFEYGVTKDVRIEIGDGTKDNPFQLRSIDSLIRMWTRNIGGQETFCYKLNNNINVQNQNFAEYMFSSKNLFKGDFDGNGKAIIGLTATKSIDGDAVGGLFAKYEPNNGNSIRDLTLSNINYNITINTPNKYSLSVGGVAGSTNGTIQNVYVSGNINVDYKNDITESAESTMYVGGIVGTMSKGTLKGTAETSMFADDMTANVALLYNGFAVSDTDTQGSHYFGGAVGRVLTASNIENVKVSSSIKAINNGDASSDTIAQASIGGLVGIVENPLIVKDSRVTPTLSGYKNVGGVVGENNAELILNHVVVEFLHNANIKNYIMGLDNIGGFVGTSTAKVSLTNSYVRSFVKDEVVDEYNAKNYCGNIIVRSGRNSVNAGGFIGKTGADIEIERSYVMGDIKSYVGSGKTEIIGGFVGGYDNTKTIKITDAYYTGKILTNKIVPNILFGSDSTPAPTTGSSMVENIVTDVVGNTMTDSKNVGEYITIKATKTEGVSYQDYEYSYSDNINISNFYASVNDSHHIWTEKDQTAYTLRTPKNVVKSTLYMTFARMTSAYIVYTGYKVVEDSNIGKKTKHNLFEIQNESWFEVEANQTNYVDTDKSTLFAGLGFDGKIANVVSVGNAEKFVLNAGSFGNPNDDVVLVSSKDGYDKNILIQTLLNTASSKTVVDESINTLLAQCTHNSNILDESFEITEMSKLNINDLYAYNYSIENISEVVKVVIGDENNIYYVKDSFEIVIQTTSIKLYLRESTIYINSNTTIEFANVVIEKNVGGAYIALGNTDTANQYIGSDGDTYYYKGEKYYTDAEHTTEVGASIEIRIAMAGYQVCDLIYKRDAKEVVKYSNVMLNSSGEDVTVVFDGKTYNVESNKVLLGATYTDLVKVYGFNYTNGNVVNEEDYTTQTIEGVVYVVDSDGNIVAKYVDSKFVSDNKNASWIVSENINNGMPTIIRKLNDGEKVETLDVLYDAVSNMNVKVTEFNYDGSSNLTPYKQGYIMLDESNVILFYNTPSEKYNTQNTYILAGSDEKAELDSNDIGGQVPVVIDFSDVLLNSPFKLHGLKDYIITSSNPNVVAIGTNQVNGKQYTALDTLDTGFVTLTLTNRYDDTNTFSINLYVVAGMTGVVDTGSMSTYVQKTNTYSFGFDNILTTGEESYNMDANVGGYTIKVVSGDDNTSFTFNGVELNKDTTDTYKFDMSNAIVIYGEKAGVLYVTLTPFVKYGDGQECVLDYLSRSVSIEINDIAKSISTGSNTTTTVKPESTVKFDVDVISSKADEEITTYITDRHGTKYIYKDKDDSDDDDNSLVDIYILQTHSIELENNLHKITYTVYLELNDEEYYKYYVAYNFKNPLEEMLSYSFEFVPVSWYENDNIIDEYKDKTAHYVVNIEGNAVSNVTTTFYNTKVDNQDVTYEEEKIYSIDSNVPYLTKLAPGRVGLLRLKVSKDYNNLSYLAVRTSNNNVTLRQADATTDADQKFSHIKVANTPVNNGIKLWNMIYRNSDTDSINMNYANYYYVFVMFDDRIVGGSTVELQISAYGKGDVELIPSVTVSVEVDYLPQIEITDAFGETEADNPIGEYRRIYINASHIENNLSWSVEPKGDMYGFVGTTVVEKTTYEYKKADKKAGDINPNLFPHIRYKTANGYERLANNFTLDMINSLELYIYIPNNTYLGEFEFKVSGYRVINTVPNYTFGTFTLSTLLFDIEDIAIEGANGGVLNLPVGNVTALNTRFRLNTYAQGVYSDYENKKYPETDSQQYNFAKYLYETVESLRKAGAGHKLYGNNSLGYDGWYFVPDKGETQQMNNGSYYPDDTTANFKFDYVGYSEEDNKIGKYRVTAFKISRNTLQYQLNLKIENGIYTLDESSSPYIYKQITFTLQITDSSTADHPIPIYNTIDFVQMCESISEEQVNQEVSNNTDVDPSELVFGNYILLNDITLESWVPHAINVSSFDGNGFTITIESWDFSSIIEDNTLSAGLFTKIGEYTVIKNLNINIAPLLSEDTTKDNAKTQFVDTNGDAIEEVTFGVVSAENAGVISNVKVVSTDNTKGEYLNLWSKQGYSNGELCSATISGFVATNSGAISDSFVGLNAVGTTVPMTKKNGNNNGSDNIQIYPFTLVGGNKLSGFVHQNNGIISNSYVMGVSIENQTEISQNSMTAGFVNQNANNGSIYSCFVSGSDYNDDIVDLRAKKTHIYSKGNVGGFVYENQGTIENAYSIINIVVQTVYSGGFAYKNISSGVIKNAYTTSTTSNINSLAHGMFVYSNEASLQNAYYLLLEGELGINSTNKSDDVLKALDPANAIVSLKPSSTTGDKKEIAFANAGSFEGFTFASDKNSYDGIWYLDGETYYPKLVNTINYNIVSVRTLASTTTSSSGDENQRYDYTYSGPNIGSEKNPIVISQPAQFAKYIVANTQNVGDMNVGDMYVFGGKKAEDSTYAPAYVRIINNISLAKINLSDTYTYNSAETEKIPLSKVVFAGYLIGNGMTISDITLNNTSTTGNNLEDFGLFKQIGLSSTQRENFYSKTDQQTLVVNPLIYNLKLSYNELSDRDANKVGLLAGSMYGGSIMGVTIEGKKDVVENTVSTITGHNLVGAVAGLIQGDVVLTDITVKNVRVNATRNTIDSLSDSYNDTGSYYESFAFGQNKTAYKTIEFGEDNNISNLSQISYAGGVAGVIIANNLTKDKGENEIKDLTDMTTYTLSDYQNSSVKIHDIVVKDNVEISGDMAGGLFGYAKNTHIRSSAFLLMQGANGTDTYQRIFGRAFGGGLVGQTDSVVFERTNIYHADQEYQNLIDTTIAQITSDAVSKNDLFLKGDASTVESVSVAIGGMVGLSKDMIVLDSYSKVNVYNPKSKIAGGMIGYAEGKNGIFYSFTYGNVKAKEVIGGLIGFYRYNSFDLYLNNAFALNVWGSDVQNTLKTNLTAVYGSRFDYTLRMPEIGNQMSEYSDGDVELTGKTNSVIADGNSTFTYIGSVLGKATLNNGVYTSGSRGITITNGKLGDKSVKDLFVRGDSSTKIINADKTAVRLFISTTDNNGNYTIDTDPVRVDKVVYNKVGTGDGSDDKEYYTYIGDQFHNVYSSLYGVTTRTGSASENNLHSEFNGLTPNNADVDKSELKDNEFLTETNEKNKNAIRYSTIFGTQYAISQITGYYQVSGKKGGVEYRNLFNEPTFTHVFSETTVDMLKNLEFKEKDKDGKVTNTTTYPDYVSATNAKATAENLSSWYFDESTGLLRYRVGSDGSVTKIIEHEQLINVLNSNTKGKTYSLDLSADSSSVISSGGSTNARFSERFRGIINGKTDETGTKKQTVNMTLDRPVFEVLEGAKLSNIIFKIDLSDLTSANATNYKDGSWGLFAQYIDRTTFTNCDFVFNNVKINTISTYNLLSSTTQLSDITISKYAGLLFGRMLNSTLTNCNLRFNFADSVSNVTVKNTTSGFGAIAGKMTGGNISYMNVNINKPIIVENGGFGKNSTTNNLEFKSDSIVGYETNIGGLVGIVDGAEVSNICNNVSIETTGAVRDGDSTIGGLFGLVSNGSQISNCNYKNNMDVNVSVVSNDKPSTISIGGVIGKLSSSTISNYYFNGSMDINGNYTDASSSKSFNVVLTNKSQNTKYSANNYIGGVVGQISGYTNTNNVVINRVPINVTINADVGQVADDNIYVGGIFGADTNGNATSIHEKMFVTGDINVKVVNNTGSNLQDTLYVGGAIGMSSSGVEDSYMQGDITIDGAKNSYAGGLVGAISNNVTFTQCVMYGDIRYVLNTKNQATYNLAGIVGGRIGAPTNDISSYKFESCIVLASIYEVRLNGSAYEMETENTTGNKYSSNKYTGLYISPFISGINVDYVIIDNTDFYIIEDYFDFYYEKESRTDKVEKKQSTYGTSTVGRYYYDVWKTLKGTSCVGTQKPTSDIEFGDTVFAFANHYIFGKTYENGTKYNPNMLDSVSGSVSGYNIVTNNITLSTDLTVNRNAVLAGDKTSGVMFSGEKTVTNNGVIENISFNWDGVIDTNNGVLHNVVAYGENKTTPSTDTTLYGLVNTNNGYIYRSGAIVVYTGLTKSNNNIQIGGLVRTNTNIIGLSYCSSMLTGLKYDKDSTAYVIGSDGNMTTTELGITSGGIAYTNSGTIADSIFNGTLYGGKQDLCNIAYTSSPADKIKGTYSDKNSMYYNKESDVSADTRFETGNSDYLVNFGRPYVTGGIKISTGVNKTASTITYFDASQNIYPVFNITDFNNITGKSMSSANAYVLLNDLYVGYTKDVYSTQNLTGTFYGQGYSIVGDSTSDIANTTHSIPLFAGAPNIENLNIHNFATTANGILGGKFEGSGKTLKNINIKDSKLSYSGTANYAGVAVGALSGYTTDTICIDNVKMSFNPRSSSADDLYYGIFGNINKSTISKSINNNSCFKVAETVVPNHCYGGGIVGSAQDSTITSCTNNSDFDGCGNHGGIVGLSQSSTITGNTNTANITATYVGGISAGDVNGTYESNKVSGNLKGSIVGGHIARLSGGTILFYNLTVGKDSSKSTIKATTKAGGVIADVPSFGTKISISGLTIQNTNITATGEGVDTKTCTKAGGIFGDLDMEFDSTNSTTRSISLSGIEIENNVIVKSGHGYAGGVAGSLKDNIITYSDLNTINVKVVLSIKVTDDKGTTKYYNANDWAKQVENNGWVTGTRFGQIGFDSAAKEYFGFNTNGKQPLGYSMFFRNEDIRSNGYWQAPLNKENGFTYYTKTINHGRYNTYEMLPVVDIWKTDKCFQSHIGLEDDSKYYSNMTKDSYFKAYTIKNRDIKVYSGILYGNLGNLGSIDTTNLKISDASLVCEYDNEGTISYKTSNKYLLDRYTQWIYTSVETGSWNNSGLMVIEYNIYASYNELVGRRYNVGESFLNDYKQKDGDPVKEANKIDEKKCIDVYIAYHIVNNKDKGHFFGCTCKKNDYSKQWKLSNKIYKVNPGYVGDEQLYTHSIYGVIRNFYNTLNKKGEMNDIYDIDKIAVPDTTFYKNYNTIMS